MALTLLEAAKTAQNNGEVQRAAVIEMFARSSQWLAAMPWQSIPGNAYTYNRENTLPGVAFRGINEGYSESTGVVNPLTEALKIAGGDLDVDVSLVRMFGPGRRALQEAMKVKSLAAEVTRVMIKGDSTSEPREFDGLQARLTGAQLIENGNTSGGDPLKLIKLDEAIDAVPGANAILLSRAMRRRFAAALRTSGVAGNIQMTPGQFGMPQYTYAGIPLLVPYEDNGGTEPLAFNEAGGGGGTTATSVYVVRFEPGYLSGLQNGTMDVRDLGEQDSKPVYRTRVEWLVSICLEHGRAAARLRGISDAAIVAA
jgi:hypothetical protein